MTATTRRTYWATFRLDKTPPHDRTYNARLAALEEAIRTSAVDLWWKEPTSFILFFSNLTIDQIVAAIKPAIDEKRDLVLLSMTEILSARLIGKSDHAADLRTLMPFVK
jgi:FAD/FMN-containing dehydrogenase